MRLPKSIRMRIYDAVKAGVDEKGCWTASEDGFEFRRWIRGQDNYQGRKKYPAGSGESWVCKEMKERGVYD